jgi:hypothetical protein
MTSLEGSSDQSYVCSEFVRLTSSNHDLSHQEMSLYLVPPNILEQSLSTLSSSS